MNVLVTGAFGNIGSNAVPELLAQGHRVRCLSVSPRADRRLAAAWSKAYPDRVEVVRGDVRTPADLAAAVAGQDLVVHLAYVIPPLCLEQPESARAINVDGTRNLLAAMRAARAEGGAPPRLVFASTLDVYGQTQHLPPPRRVDDPLSPTDVYTHHKVTCEGLVRASGLRWSILRFADVPPIALRKPHPIMFSIPLSQRIEMIHPRDAGLAVANAVGHDGIWERVLHIGGGARCQLTYGEYLGAFLEAMGIGALPSGWFATEPYCTDWLDSEDSQRMLRFQRHGFEDVVRETAALLGWRAPLARLFRPLVRWRISHLSPYRDVGSALR